MQTTCNKNKTNKYPKVKPHIAQSTFFSANVEKFARKLQYRIGGQMCMHITR